MACAARMEKQPSGPLTPPSASSNALTRPQQQQQQQQQTAPAPMVTPRTVHAHYDPNIHSSAPSGLLRSATAVAGTANPTPEREAAVQKAAEEHRTMLFQAYMQAMKSS